MVEKEGESWFNLKDVGDVLGLRNPRDFTKSEWCDQKGVDSIYILTEGGNQQATFINERNLYAMVAQSRKPEAKRFMDWVYGEVLPRIRKDGKYEISTHKVDNLPANDPLIQTMSAMITLRQTQIDHEQRISALETSRAESAQAVLALPGAEARELTAREACREGIRQLVELAGMDFQYWWKKAYAEYDIIARTCVTKMAENRKMEKLAYIESHGSMDMLLGVINRLKRKAAETATA